MQSFPRPFVLAAAFGLVWSLTIAVQAAHAGSEFDAATGLRIANYRGPTPLTVVEGAVVTLDELERLHRERHAVLLDVMSAEGAGPDPVTGHWRLSKPRRHMAGSVWLPDVGRGTVTGEMDAYFRENLDRLTSGDKTFPIVVYCQADCWMSWNAVKRAAGYGYSALYWYRDGTDGMADWDVPLVEAQPIPVQPKSK